MNRLKSIYGIALLAAASLAAAAYAAGQQVIMSPAQGSYIEGLKALLAATFSDYQPWMDQFLYFQNFLGRRLFFGIIVLIPLVFLIHLVLVGPKRFSHKKGMVYYFSLFARVIHWVAAASFTLLVITGLMVIFAKPLGGGELVLQARHWHAACALVFVISAVPMFLMWLKDMLPAAYDIKWFFILGGYLSKKKVPVPAGRFNAGQKVWFWLATAGGGVMAWTGWYIYSLGAPTPELRLYVLIHSYLAAALTAFFLVHLYMSLFAIKGAIKSMISGYKPLEEVEILHSRFKVKRVKKS